MVLRRWILMFLAAGVIALASGCGGTSTNVQNPPGPAASNVSVVFQPGPPSSIKLNSTTKITAVVQNDPSAAGVDWSLTCQNPGNCGTLGTLHTPSGVPATYTPPASIPGNSQSVTILAFATADHTKNAAALLTINGFGGGLKGTFVLQTAGSDINGFPYQLAGVLVLDGNSGISTGEQTTNYFDQTTGLLTSVSDAVIGGSYRIGGDGRGTLTIQTANPNIGQLGTENLSFVILSSSHLLVGTLDDPNLQISGEASVGTLDMQTSTAAPTAGYAFSVSGTDVATASPTAVGGVMNIDSPDTISGVGSVADQDLNDAVFLNATLSGTVTGPDAFGAVKFDLNTSFASGIEFTGYIVDSTHIRLIESDGNGTSATGALTTGQAIAQGAATGTFTSNSAFAGNYVFSIFGQDLSGFPSSLASVGNLTADSSGNVNGYNDEFLEGFGILVSDLFTGTYILDPAGTGRVDTGSGITYQNNGPGPELIFYLTGNGNPPLVLDADVSIGSLGAGVAYPQAAPPLSFDGLYGLDYLQASGVTVNDATGQINVVGAAGTLSGIVDTNLGFSPNPNSMLTGNFGPVSTSGRFTGTLANTFFPTFGNAPNTLGMAFYLIDSSHGVFIETDSALLTLGYFATRTPTQ